MWESKAYWSVVCNEMLFLNVTHAVSEKLLDEVEYRLLYCLNILQANVYTVTERAP